jgi:hypothetical protein
VLSGILRAPRVTEGSFKDVDVEDDEFTVVYSTHQHPRIANDTIIMDRSLVTDSQVLADVPFFASPPSTRAVISVFAGAASSSSAGTQPGTTKQVAGRAHNQRRY